MKDAFALGIIGTGAVVVMAAVVAVALLLNGVVLSILWGWFVVPTFGLQPLTIAQAIGLVLIVGFLRLTIDTKKDTRPDHPAGHQLALLVGFPALYLALGWVVLQLINSGH